MDPSLFTINLSHSPQSLLAVPNARRPLLRTPQQRQNIVAWLRQAFVSAKPPDAAYAVGRHFLENEAGFTEALHQDLSAAGRSPGVSQPILVSGNPLQPQHPLRRLIEQHAKAGGVVIKWINHGQVNYDPSEVDVCLQGAPHENDRQIWMQDVLHFRPMSPYLGLSPAVIATFERVSLRSLSTIPVDNETLQNLETAAAREGILLPLARYSIALFSRKDAPIELVHAPQDEFTFRIRSQ